MSYGTTYIIVIISAYFSTAAFHLFESILPSLVAAWCDHYLHGRRTFGERREKKKSAITRRRVPSSGSFIGTWKSVSSGTAKLHIFAVVIIPKRGKIIDGGREEKTNNQLAFIKPPEENKRKWRKK